MSKGRHASGNSRTPVGPAIGILSAAVGLVLIPVSVAELLRYSPYEDPGAGQAGLALGIAAVALIGLPVLFLGTHVASRLMRAYSAWKKTLTPQQRMALGWAEFGGLMGLHLFARHENRKTGERLAASVMGGEDDPRAPGDPWSTAA